MSWIITGGAGFIGSCLISKLNSQCVSDLIIVDNIGKSSKWRNISNKQFQIYIPKQKLFDSLNTLPDINGIVHLGACSSTTETDFDYLYANNYQYSVELYRFCAQRNIPFIYASSASVYGDGTLGFSEDVPCCKLTPLNRYGYSKKLFDEWLDLQEKHNNQCVGLRFFNVYGPNEYHKGTMASMVYHGFRQITTTGKIRLFKSDNPQYPHGEQSRDFVFVNDVCNVIIYFMQHPEYSGVYNVGTGRCYTFNDLAEALFSALSIPSSIEYIDMPENLKLSYQYCTKADIEKLRKCGYVKKMTPLGKGVREYVDQYLCQSYKVL